MGKKIDLTGEIFGKLLVLGIADTLNGRIRWDCICECGRRSKPHGSTLRKGLVKSCGCIRKEGRGNKKHGMRKTRPYSIWADMKKRCNNPNHAYFKYYGGNGVSYDPRWEDFSCFWEDMGESYNDKLTLDRINTYGAYCKDNCRWATSVEQGFNQKLRYDNITGVAGVYFRPTKKGTPRWHVKINDGPSNETHVGYFYNFREAVLARLNEELEIYGVCKIAKKVLDELDLFKELIKE